MMASYCKAQVSNLCSVCVAAQFAQICAGRRYQVTDRGLPRSKTHFSLFISSIESEISNLKKFQIKIILSEIFNNKYLNYPF
jgi:hypothetical protein